MLTREMVENVVSSVSKYRGVEISEQVIDLVVMASNSLENDPHPVWSLQPQFSQLLASSELDQSQLSVLEAELNELAESLGPRDRNKITFFHALHWIADSNFLKGWPVPKEEP